MSEQGWLENFGAFDGFVQIKVGDVRASNFEIDGVGHGADLVDGLPDVLQVAGLLVEFESNVGSGALSEGSVEVWSLHSSLCLPSLLFLVGQNSSGKSIR